MTDVRDFLSEMDAVLDTMSEAGDISATFRSELERTAMAMARAKKETADTERMVSRLQSSMGSSVKGAVDDMLLEGVKFSDAIRGVAQSLIDSTYNAALRPVTNQVGDAIGGLVGGLFGGATPFANGGAFAQGRVMPFAKGGVFDSPVAFPMRGGTGVMGEAGPEAIMPLTRGPDGRLGVRAQGGGGAGGVNITMNISTPDAQSFRRSQGQVAAQVSRALARGNRNS